MARGSNQQTSSLWFGNHGNFTKHEVDLHKGEHITSVSLRHGAIVDQLSFETSLGRQFTFGGSGGSPFQLDIPEGHRVVAFKGGFGGHIHSIGAVTTPLRPCGDASSWNTALHAVHFDKDFRAIVKTLFIMRTTTVTDETQQLEPKYKDSQWWMLPLEVFEMIVKDVKEEPPPEPSSSLSSSIDSYPSPSPWFGGKLAAKLRAFSNTWLCNGVNWGDASDVEYKKSLLM
ncbi:Jacalin-type lectin domain-containing protein [Balamuthia mandrillaris]